MKTKQLIATGTLLLAFGATAAFAGGPSCNINALNNPNACTAKVSNLSNNNVPFTLLNVTPTKNYSCNIVIEDDRPEQVIVQNMQGENGAAVTVQGRSDTVVPFTVSNNSSSIGMVQFTMHNGRRSVWKNESNTVYVECNSN